MTRSRLPCERAAEQLLVGERPVGLGGVEEGDAELERRGAGSRRIRCRPGGRSADSFPCSRGRVRRLRGLGGRVCGWGACGLLSLCQKAARPHAGSARPDILWTAPCERGGSAVRFSGGTQQRISSTCPPSASSTSSRSASGPPARIRSVPGARPSARSGAGRDLGLFDAVVAVRVDLYGSLAKTGRGHMTDVAVMLGLSDEDPVTCRTADIPATIENIRRSRDDRAGRSAHHPLRSRRGLPLQYQDQSAAASQRPHLHRRPGATDRPRRRPTTPSGAASSSRRESRTRAVRRSRCPSRSNRRGTSSPTATPTGSPCPRSYGGTS